MALTREEALATGQRVEVILEYAENLEDLNITMVPREQQEDNSLQVFAGAVLDEVVRQANEVVEKSQTKAEGEVGAHLPATPVALVLDIQIEADVTHGVTMRVSALPPEEDLDSTDEVVKACYAAWNAAQVIINEILTAANQGRSPEEAEGIFHKSDRDAFLAGKKDLI